MVTGFPFMNIKFNVSTQQLRCFDHMEECMQIDKINVFLKNTKTTSMCAIAHLSIRNNRFHLIDHVSSCLKYLLFIMMLSHLIEELNDICEVHVPVNDDISVCLHQTEGYEEVKLWGGYQT